MFVAVIARVGVEQSDGPHGVWSSFVGKDRDEVILRAMQHTAQSNKRLGKYTGQYGILVGELTHEAVEPVKYELVPIAQEEVHWPGARR